MNILLTCAGRRSYLVDYFKEALEGNGNVYTVNSTADATSMIVADGAFVAPSLYKKEYIDFLKRICREYNIELLVSLFDLELPVLAKHKKEFEELGVAMAVSEPEVIAICNDKVKTGVFLDEMGLSTLFTTTNLTEATQQIEDENIEFPLFIKPRWGMGSIAMQEAETVDELNVLFKKVQRDIKRSYLKYYPSLDLEASVIVQEKAKGKEYGLDIINDLEGNYITTFVKQKLAMRSGETDGAVTENVPELFGLGKKIGRHLGHVGNLDVDVFWDGEHPIILEMNARFGGGYPFSHLAGANVPKVYIDWVRGNIPKEDDLSVSKGVKGFKELSILNYSQIKELHI